MPTPNQSPDGGPSPEDIVGYRLLPGRYNQQLRRAQRGIQAFASRTWGDYHRFLTGKMLEPGEREVYRVSLRSAAVFAVDRQVSIARHPTCIVTDRRVLVRDDLGHALQLRRREIRAVRIRRLDHPQTGSAYYIALEREGSLVRDPGGDVALHCQNRRDCDELTAALG
jgi:hypothetical protein